MPSPEHLIQNQLAACLAAMDDCLTQSRRPRDDDPHGHQRRADLAYVAKLMKASARMTEALARLKGQTRHAIHVSRGVEAPTSEGASRSAQRSEGASRSAQRSEGASRSAKNKEDKGEG